MKISPVFAVLWAFWMLGAIVGYFQGSWWAALATGGVFGILEGAGVARKGTGDTYTEQIRAFYAGKPARAFLVLGIVGFLGMWMVSFVPRWQHLYDWAGISLGAGLVLWLIPHFLVRKGGEMGHMGLRCGSTSFSKTRAAGCRWPATSSSWL